MSQERERNLLELALTCIRQALGTDDTEIADELFRIACEYVAQASKLNPSLTATDVRLMRLGLAPDRR